MYTFFSGAEGGYARFVSTARSLARGSSENLIYGEFRGRLHAHPFELRVRD